MNQQELFVSCSMCRELKPYTDFYKNTRRSRGVDYRCKQCTKEHYPSKKYYRKGSHAMRKYNISEEEYLELFDTYKECQLCESKDNLHLDHCHTTGTIRGVLCNKCNQGLGLFNDDVSLLLKAVEWLKK